MRIGMLGTGSVGQTLGTKLVSLGHEVRMGSREKGNEKAVGWAKAAGPKASQGSFADAASFGELLFNCTSGRHSLEALRAAGEPNLSGKVLVDVANPLELSKGAPPTLAVANSDSLAEQIQRAFPKAKVVKALNTISAALMVNPQRLGGDHDLFVCGDDAAARRQVVSLLKEGFGWRTVHDLGDLTAARGMEAWLLLWARLMGAFGSADFNLHIVRG